ncbi:uncharacterized protein BP01DRAFT_51253 [Aspergillus saccharolyticus JOP 1030-1]|uniref:Uncharacterized protein n=1 Tax=Aspergillus saccharolyticus JOP 1030-1 TaxID=1450539 RepID=A0A318ZZ92_9EURO|nr:hypothetical protein BP01DRAFT_51253 [Aspergillus saccharolyticus JOP 1030-1]PYH45408.1 hypothetical protein BP01DRAFT_51253 [Aspergillus saccharolyticus JOP 1030-1]
MTMNCCPTPIACTACFSKSAMKLYSADKLKLLYGRKLQMVGPFKTRRTHRVDICPSIAGGRFCSGIYAARPPPIRRATHVDHNFTYTVHYIYDGGIRRQYHGVYLTYYVVHCHWICSQPIRKGWMAGYVVDDPTERVEAQPETTQPRRGSIVVSPANHRRWIICQPRHHPRKLVRVRQ